MSANPEDEDAVPSSPFDVDIGGSQRAELRAQLRTVQSQLASVRQERAMLETQVDVLRRLQQEAKVAHLISYHRMHTLQPAFAAWGRFVVGAKGSRTAARLTKDAEVKAAAMREKEEQVAALVDRVSRVKAKAQSKLSELHSANQQMAAALAQRDEELKAVKLHAKRLRTCELQTVLRALSTADGDLAAAHAELLARSRHQDVLLDGLRAELAAFRLEAMAQRKLARYPFDGDTSLPVGEPIILASALPGALGVSAEAVELRRCRRALLSTTFWGWADRVALVRGLRGEAGEWGTKLEEARGEVAALRDALERAEDLAGARGEENERLVAELRAERERAASALAEASARQLASDRDAERFAAEVCAREAFLHARLASFEDERSQLIAVAERRANELLHSEEVLRALAARAHREAHVIGSPAARGR